MSKVNVDELDAVLDYIEANPQKWNQARWCGTACCVAGHVALRAGWKHRLGPNPFNNGTWNDSVVQRGDQERTAHQVARNVLGVSEGQSDYLFHSTNTLPTLRIMARALREDPDADLDAFVVDEE